MSFFGDPSGQTKKAQDSHESPLLFILIGFYYYNSNTHSSVWHTQNSLYCLFPIKNCCSSTEGKWKEIKLAVLLNDKSNLHKNMSKSHWLVAVCFYSCSDTFPVLCGLLPTSVIWHSLTCMEAAHSLTRYLLKPVRRSLLCTLRCHIVTPILIIQQKKLLGKNVWLLSWQVNAD